jgi:sulfur carrier protein
MSTRDVGEGAEPTIVITVNGERHAVAAGTTALEMVERLGLAGRPVAVEVDGEVVPRARLAGCGFGGGERVEIVTFVGGG